MVGVGGGKPSFLCITDNTFALLVILPTKNLQGPGLAFNPDKTVVYSPLRLIILVTSDSE